MIVLLVFIASLAVLVKSIVLDIHIPLTDGCPLDQANLFNTVIRVEDENEYVNFETVHTPHITLY